jgi:hypothetical protein
MRIDVVLLLFKRPEHTFRVLDSLRAEGVTSVRAFMDHSDDPGVQRIQAGLVSDLSAYPGLSVDVVRHPEHLGLARSVRHALDTTLRDADAAILLEDDCVLRPGAMDFFRQGLSALRFDTRIRSLCGYLFPCSFVRSGAEPLLLRRFSTWGWATWRDRWREYDPNLARVIRRLEARDITLDDLGRDLATLCRAPDYLKGRPDVWSLNWILEHYASGTFAVYPSDSLIENIGLDGSGNNCRPTAAFETLAGTRAVSFDFGHLFHCTENEDLLKSFMAERGLLTYPGSL